MRRFAPLFVICGLFLLVGTGCEVTTDEVCYFDGVEYDCGGDACPYWCDDGTGYFYCTDLSQPDDCGECGATCYDGVCVDMVCQAAGYICEDYGLVTCYDGAYEYCADVLTDDYNCGDCGVECVMGCDGAGACL